MEKHKVTIITGDTDLTKKIFDGHALCYGDINKGFHVNALLEFLNEKYGELDIVKSLNTKYSPEMLAFVVTTFGHVVFLNLNKNSKIGVLLLPWSISERQRIALDKMLKELKDYDFYIMYNLKIVDGLLEGLECECINEQMPKFIDDFINNKEELIKKSSPYL